MNERTDIEMKKMVEMVLEHPNSTVAVIQPPLFVKDKKHARISTKPRVKLFQYNYTNKILLPSRKTKPYSFVGTFPTQP